MSDRGCEGDSRFLVLHDYGMGGLWWWVWARSPEEIVDVVAEVEVVTDGAAMQRVGSWGLEAVHLHAVDLGSLTDLRDQRAAHRYLPGFGVLAARALVYLREDSPEYGGAVYLTEVGPDGRRLRQVEQLATGDSLRTDDWPFNSPIDLRDPQYVPKEISPEAFEAAWHNARPDPDA